MTLQSECADELRRLAADPAYGNRADDLRGLADAVTDTNDDSWTGIDLIGAFPTSTAVTVAHKSTGEKWLGAGAGVSVFLPVAWTWWSFREASAAYSGILDEGADAGRTFLAMWTSGFDGRLAFMHQLVPMAMLSVALIVVAMGLIVAHRVVSQMNVTAEEKRTTDAQSRLMGALTTAQRCLNERRSDDPTYIATMLRNSVRELRDAQNDLKSSAETLTTTTTEVSDKLTPMLEAATEAAQELKSAATAAKDASADLGKSVDGLSAGVTKSIGDLESGIEGNVTKLTDTTAESLEELGDKAADAVNQLNTDAAGAVSGIGGDLTKLSEAVDRISTTNRNAGTTVETSVEQLKELLSGLDEALQRHDSALQGQNTEIVKANDQAARLLRQLEQHFPANGGSGGQR